MTDKQIIECHFKGDDERCNAHLNEVFWWKCYEFDNCLYKKYKAKEQECEELKDELILKDVANIELSDEVKKYRKVIDEIEEIADNNYENPEMERIVKIVGGLDV